MKTKTWRIRMGLAGILFVCCLLVGCASVPRASNQLDSTAKSFSPVQDKAVVYIYRKGKITGSAVALQLTLDGKIVGATGPATYLRWELPPGTYTLGSQNMSSAPMLKLTCEKGKIYFVEQRFHTWDTLLPWVSLHLIDAKEAEAQVKKCRLVESSL